MASMDIIAEENIKEIFEKSNTETIREIVAPIQKAMEIFQRNISTLSYLPDVERVTIRVETLQKIIEALIAKVDGKQDQILEEAGWSIGETFADDLFKYLLKLRKLPQSKEVLVRIANEFDTIAQWGEFRTVFSDKAIITEIRNPLFSRKNEKKLLDNILKGYVSGFMWYALKYHHRLFNKHIIRTLDKPISVYSSEMRHDHDVCTISLKIMEEKLVNGFDHLFYAKFALQEGNVSESVKQIRASIEQGFKEKIGANVNSQLSVLKIIKAFKDEKILMPLNAISEIYGSASSDMHSSSVASPENLKKWIDLWKSELRKLEWLELSPDTMKSIKNSVGI